MEIAALTTAAVRNAFHSVHDNVRALIQGLVGSGDGFALPLPGDWERVAARISDDPSAVLRALSGLAERPIAHRAAESGPGG